MRGGWVLILTTCWWTGTTSTRPSGLCTERSSQTSTGDPPPQLLLENYTLGLSALCCGEGSWPSIMLTFTCQLDSTTGCPGMWWNPVSGRLAFALAQSKAGVGGHHSTAWGSKQNKAVKEGRILCLSECWARTLVPSCPQTRTHIIGSLCFSGLWTLSGLDHHFPGSPACRWKTVGLLCLHNCVSQFHFILPHPHPSPTPDCFWFSENPNVPHTRRDLHSLLSRVSVSLFHCEHICAHPSYTSPNHNHRKILTITTICLIWCLRRNEHSVVVLRCGLPVFEQDPMRDHHKTKNK